MLERVLTGKTHASELLKNRPKPTIPSKKARIPAKVVFDNTAGQSATLIEIVAEDRPGLLYDLATGITNHNCNIEVVLIDTQAHKAIDVFYITRQGSKLSELDEERLRKRLLDVL